MQPRGATPRLRSGEAAESARLGTAQEQPRGATPTQGQGQRPGGPPHIQGAVAAWAQEGLEELSHVEGQKGRRRGDTPRPGKEQWLRFAGAAVKR